MSMSMMPSVQAPQQDWGQMLAGVAGLAGSAYGLSTTGSSVVPNAWTPGTGAQSSPFNYQGDLLGQYYGAANAYPVQNYPAQNYGMFQGQAQGLLNNPYGALQLGGASSAAGMAPTFAGYNAQGAGQLAAMGGAAGPYASQILQAGFDPQQALYGRTQQQVQDQTQAALNRTGVGSSPYGGGIMGKTLSDFNLDWQDRQLGRMGTAATGYGNLVSGTGNAFSTASNLGQQGINTLVAGTAAPYNAYATQIGNNMAALGQLNQAGQQTWQLPQNAFTNANSLIQNNQSQLTSGLNMANANNSRQQQYGQGIGQGLSSIGGMLGGLLPFPGGGILGSAAGSLIGKGVDFLSDLFG